MEATFWEFTKGPIKKLYFYYYLLLPQLFYYMFTCSLKIYLHLFAFISTVISVHKLCASAGAVRVKMQVDVPPKKTEIVKFYIYFFEFVCGYGCGVGGS